MNKNIVIGILLLIIVTGGVYFGTRKEIVDQPVQVISTSAPVVAETQSSPLKTVTSDKAPASKNIKVYAEPDTGNDRILGASGEQMRLIVSTSFPATVTYDVTFSTAVVYPGAVAKDVTYKETVSVNAGKTILETFNAIDGKTSIHFTYVDNTGKTAAQITPAVKLKAELYWYGVGGLPGDEITKYEISVHSSSVATLTYTATYTPEINGQSQTVTKTVPVPLGKSIVTDFMSSTTPVITYSFK